MRIKMSPYAVLWQYFGQAQSRSDFIAELKKLSKEEMLELAREVAFKLNVDLVTNTGAI